MFRIMYCIGVLFLLLMGYMHDNVESTFTNKVEIKKAMRDSRPPMIKMMKRRLRVLEHGERASITLVFYTTRNTYVRWFHREGEETMNLEGSEIRGFFPVDGDKNYEMRYLVAGRVVAATLYIHKYNKSQEKEDFVTIITTHDGRLQYNLMTTIYNTVDKRVSVTDDIDGPEWDMIPATVEFEVGKFLEIGCQVFVPYELKKKIKSDEMRNELWLNRATGKLTPNASSPFIENIFGVYADADPMKIANRSEKAVNDPKIVTGIREPFRKLGHVLYKVKMTTTNATADLQGIYQCSMERWRGMYQFEKSYAIGEATIKGHMSAFVGSPGKTAEVIVKPCNGIIEKYGRSRLEPRHQIKLVAGRKSCLRCVAIGYPRPKVYLKRQGHRVESRSDVTAVHSINVADAGVSEVTYIFHNPTYGLESDYECEAKNSGGTSTSSFHIKVIQA